MTARRPRLRQGQTDTRADIPRYYGEIYNTGNWNTGHVSLERHVVLFVTLNGAYTGQGENSDGDAFTWTSQNRCTPESKKGREILKAGSPGAKRVDLWLRKARGPFTYQGPVAYRTHDGEAPMLVTFTLGAPK